MKTIYLDNSATTKVDPEVMDVMDYYHGQTYGNASSIHHEGKNAKKALGEARSIIANSLGANDDEIIFTSGGTEANNLAIKGMMYANEDKGRHLITTKIEHDCVLNSGKALEAEGFDVTYLDVDSEGFVSPEALEKNLREDTVLVSIIHANNEIGTIQDIQRLSNICKQHDVLFHTDACQSYTKTPITTEMADLITINAHKLHGPKGVGALYVKQGTAIKPLLDGGGHERKRRSGTENVPGIVGFAKAVELGMDEAHVNKMQALRDYLIDEILKIPHTRLNGPRGEQRLCNNANISFRFIEGESIIMNLDTQGICTSTGSACSSQTLEPSHVLMAIEDDPERAHGSVRFTISRYTTKEELDRTLTALKATVDKLRRISPLTEG
ncbi:cysteine desulfurase [Candidatus Woesearchaeota archaeon]|nr:cysteine desulfurase [Candidatus Woesearchaeota archaeon]